MQWTLRTPDTTYDLRPLRNYAYNHSGAGRSMERHVSVFRTISADHAYFTRGSMKGSFDLTEVLWKNLCAAATAASQDAPTDSALADLAAALTPGSPMPEGAHLI